MAVQEFAAPLDPPALTVTVAARAPSIIADLTYHVPALAVSVAAVTPDYVGPEEDVIIEDVQTLEPYNLSVEIDDYVAGDDLRISRTYTGLAGGISISKAYLTIKRYAADADAAAIIQKQIDAASSVDGEITDASTIGGTLALYFDLSGDETALLTPPIPFQYDIQIVTIAGAVYTCEPWIDGNASRSDRCNKLIQQIIRRD